MKTKETNIVKNILIFAQQSTAVSAVTAVFLAFASVGYGLVKYGGNGDGTELARSFGGFLFIAFGFAIVSVVALVARESFGDKQK